MSHVFAFMTSPKAEGMQPMGRRSVEWLQALNEAGDGLMQGWVMAVQRARQRDLIGH